MLILILINVQYSQKAFCILHVFFNIQADYVVYIKKHIETDTTWVKWELKTPLLNNELKELDPCTNSNILPWILCHYFVHGSYIWNIFFTEDKILCNILKFRWPWPSHFLNWQAYAIEKLKNL